MLMESFRNMLWILSYLKNRCVYDSDQDLSYMNISYKASIVGYRKRNNPSYLVEREIVHGLCCGCLVGCETPNSRHNEYYFSYRMKFRNQPSKIFYIGYRCSGMTTEQYLLKELPT